MIKASIIIPLYNSQQYIGQVLGFLTRHNENYNTEIIVVNDGSTDNSRAVASKYEDKIKLVDMDRNSGRSAARNRGIKEACGEILIFLDADCVPKDEDFFRLHLDFHSRFNGALNGQVVLAEKPDNKYIEYRHPGISSGGLCEITPDGFATGNVSVARMAVISSGGFDEEMSLFEDVDMGVRLSNLDLKFYRDDRIIVYHLDNRITLTRDMKRNFIAYSESVAKILKKNPKYKEFLPLVKTIELRHNSFLSDFKYRYLPKPVFTIYKKLELILPMKVSYRIYNFLIISSAYNGYYLTNRKFFMGLS